MDFLDPKKRKAHRVKLFIGYWLMAIALTFASIILLYQSYGYDYDPQTGQIVQNGLIFISAHPDGANARLNGESKGRTDLRLDVAAGDYSLELKEPGYRDWKRNFYLEGGSIERFAYPFLFPTNLETSDTQNYAANPGLVTQSPNRDIIVVQQPGGFQRFDLVDVSGDTAKTSVLSLPVGLLVAAGATHQLELVEWSTDNRHFVLKHTHDGGAEFAVIDIEAPANSVNLSTTFGVPFTNLALRDKKFDQYYLYNQPAQTLHSARLDAAAPVLYQGDVLAFRPHGADEVTFITAAGASEGKVLLKIREGAESYTVREIAAGSRYVVDLARFGSSWYLAAGSAEENKVYLFKDPVATIKRGRDKLPLPVAILRTPGATDYISFSANTRFIAAQSGNHFAVYDAETDRQYRYDSGLGLPPGQKIGWMDGHRLATVVNGQTTVFDYDGTNKQTLTAALNGYQPLFDNSYEALFTLSPSAKADGTPALVRTELRL